jgi:hypothetical protein
MRWLIKKVYRSPFSKEPAADPMAIYGLIISDKGTGMGVDLGFMYRNLEWLMDHFAAPTPESLSGKEFDSDKDDPVDALDYLRVVHKNNGDYVPPSPEALYEMAAQALAKMEEPCFELVDRRTILNAFSKKWDDKKWLDQLNERIDTISTGSVALVEADPETFPTKIRGPTNYMELIGPGKRIKVVIGPRLPPFVFY